MDALVETARTDELTGLPNRRAFNQELTKALARAKRHDESLALVMLDLDHFKDVNDRFGHPVGDDVLARASAVLQDAVRAGDTAARVGGEEFAVVLPAAGGDSSLMLAERIRKRIAAEFSEHGPALTASIGLVDTPSAESVDAVELMRRADQALYAAKRGGRNRVVAFSEREHGVSQAA